MRFGVLGAVEVRRADGSLVPVGGPGLRALLALLLLDAGRVVSPERLIDGLYGEYPPDGAANALQSQVSRLRRGLRAAALAGDGAATPAGGRTDGSTGDRAGGSTGDRAAGSTGDRAAAPAGGKAGARTGPAGGPLAGGIVELHPAGYRLAVDPDDVDALRFERLARAGQRALAAGDHPGAAALLDEALELWRGPALADVADAPFAAAPAARLEQLRVAAIEDRAEAVLARGGDRALVPELQELTVAYPLRERARTLLMQALHGSGRAAEALLVFEDARRALADELGADPSAELAAAHLAVLRADQATPPAGSLPPLPAQLTSFVGRTDELARIGKLLAAGRLVTLTGPGGAGKTRLAVEAGGREHGEVCFVDLAPLGGGAEVPAAALGALGLREAGLFRPGAPAQPAVDRLVPALAGRRLLLILDNCEHVLEDAARLAHRLLGACPQLRVLATSREPLGITGEALCPVPRLPVPAAGTGAPEAVGYPAVRLFADRAAAVRPDFTLAGGTLDDVLRICAALDGLPLAIELAAARLRSLPLAAVAARLDDRFGLLSRGDPTAAPRHRTLHAVVEWSWDLLDEAERTLARRLTVFAGGATLDAVVRVCGLPAADVLDLLAGLMDKSLLEGAGDRYRMLDTVRAFGAERLAEAGEAESLRRAHAGYFLELAEAARPHLRQAEQLEWLARLSAEHGNLNAALRWAATADPVLALRLLAALCWFWYLRGHSSEAGPLATELLGTLGPVATEPPPELVEAYVLCVLTATAAGTVRTGELAGHLRRAGEIMQALDRPLAEPALHVLWAVTIGPPAPDVEFTAAQVAQLVGADVWSSALLNVGTGFRGLLVGDLAVGEREFTAALARFREAGDRWGTAMALGQLGQLAAWRGDHAAARALVGEAIELAGQLGAGEDLADMLSLRAETLLADGDLAAAAADYRLAAESARLAGVPAVLARAQSGLGEVARLGGALTDSRRWQETALAGCPSGSFGLDSVRAQILVALGRTAAAEGAADEARSHLRAALALAFGHWYLPVAAGAVAALAGLALAAGTQPAGAVAAERAAVLLGAAAALRGGPMPADPDTAGVAAAARELLGAQAYAAALDRGAALPRDDLLALVGAGAGGAAGRAPEAAPAGQPRSADGA